MGQNDKQGKLLCSFMEVLIVGWKVRLDWVERRERGKRIDYF